MGLAQLVRQKEVTPSELLSCALTSATHINPEINAISEWYVQDAKREVKSLGLECTFAGVPFLIKDLVLDMAGTTCRQGSTLTLDAPAPQDSALMTRFRSAGLVTFGRTATPAFGAHLATASLLHGETLNPWNAAYSPGGSSGGAAAAVAAGITPLAHANDGLGSIRVPASACGLFGLKPTKQRTPTGPMHGDLLNGRGVEFAVCRSVRDAASLLDVTHGPDPGAPYLIPPPTRSYASTIGRPPEPLRLAFTTNSFSGCTIDANAADAVRQLATLCEYLGHSVEERSIGLDWEEYLEGLFVTVIAGTYSAIDRTCRLSGTEPSKDNLEPHLISIYERGSKFTAGELLRAQALLATSQRRTGRIFEEIDAYITPVLSSAPLKTGAIDAYSDLDSFWKCFAADDLSPFVGLFNITGQPAASVPISFPNDAPPVGVQIISRFGREDILLALAKQIEQARPWSHHCPPVHVKHL